MKILLTGITGLVGWNFWKSLSTQKKSHNLFATANKNYSQFESFKNKISIIPMTDFETLKSKVMSLSPDVIIHAAGVCDLDVCEIKIEDTDCINVRGTEALLESARLSGVNHFIYISSDHVFSGGHPPYEEDSPTDPISVYGRSRVQAENLIVNSKVPWTILRCALAIGESLQGNTGPLDWFLKRTSQKKYTDYFSDEVRSVLFVEDIIETLWRVIDKKSIGLFHLGGEEPLSRIELARRLSLVCPGTSPYIRGRLRREEKNGPPRIGDVTLDIGKAKQILDFKPQKFSPETIQEVLISHRTFRRSKKVA